MSPPRILVVANRTAAAAPLLQAVKERSREGEAVFHLVVPAEPEGLHRVVDPEVAGREAARARLRDALPLLSEAAAQEVTGQVGDADPLAAVCDALYQGGFDEIIISTLPWRVSRWLRVDLPSKLRALGVPVRHVEGSGAVARARPEAVAHARPETVTHARAETGGAAVVPTASA